MIDSNRITIKFPLRTQKFKSNTALGRNVYRQLLLMQIFLPSSTLGEASSSFWRWCLTFMKDIQALGIQDHKKMFELVCSLNPSGKRMFLIVFLESGKAPENFLRSCRMPTTPAPWIFASAWPAAASCGASPACLCWSSLWSAPWAQPERHPGSKRFFGVFLFWGRGNVA